MYEMAQSPVEIGAKVVKLGKHRRIITVVERYAEGGDIVYLGLDARNRPVDMRHQALARDIANGDAYVVEREEALAA